MNSPPTLEPGSVPSPTGTRRPAHGGRCDGTRKPEYEAGDHPFAIAPRRDRCVGACRTRRSRARPRNAADGPRSDHLDVADRDVPVVALSAGVQPVGDRERGGNRRRRCLPELALPAVPLDRRAPTPGPTGRADASPFEQAKRQIRITLLRMLSLGDRSTLREPVSPWPRRGTVEHCRAAALVHPGSFRSDASRGRSRASDETATDRDTRLQGTRRFRLNETRWRPSFCRRSLAPTAGSYQNTRYSR